MGITWNELMNKFRGVGVEATDDVPDVSKAEANQALEALSVVDTVEVSWDVAERMGLDMETHTDDEYNDHEG